MSLVMETYTVSQHSAAAAAHVLTVCTDSCRITARDIVDDPLTSDQLYICAIEVFVKRKTLGGKKYQSCKTFMQKTMICLFYMCLLVLMQNQ